MCNFYEKNLIKNARKLYQSMLKGGIIVFVRKRRAENNFLKKIKKMLDKVN